MIHFVEQKHHSHSGKFFTTESPSGWVHFLKQIFLAEIMFSSLCRAVRELRVSVPKLSVRSQTLLPVSHLRTVTNTNLNKAQPQCSESLDLPEGQTIVPADSQLRDETLNKINKSLDEGPGRMFAVVHVRGFQHKITDGKSFNPCLSSA